MSLTRVHGADGLRYPGSFFAFTPEFLMDVRCAESDDHWIEPEREALDRLLRQLQALNTPGCLKGGERNCMARTGALSSLNYWAICTVWDYTQNSPGGPSLLLSVRQV
jgi:hypothetical protein